MKADKFLFMMQYEDRMVSLARSVQGFIDHVKDGLVGLGGKTPWWHPRGILAIVLLVLGLIPIYVIGFGCLAVVWTSGIHGRFFYLLSRLLPRRGKVEAGHAHDHKDEKGMLVRCYHTCRSLLTNPAFWLGGAVMFPLDHMLWVKILPTVFPFMEPVVDYLMAGH